MSFDTETENKLSADEVKKLLKSDNTEMYNLCKKGNISLKRDKNTGRTFFLKNDVEVLKKLKDLFEKGEQMETATMPEVKVPVAIENKISPMPAKADNALLMNVLAEVKDSIVDQISGILDEKLDGMDEVVVELINAKTENERLKQKLDAMTKENYKLRKEIDSFKPLKFGIYIKA